MQKNQLFVFILFLFTGYTGISQSETEPPAKIYEIGLNSTLMIDQLLNFSNSGNQDPGPYVITYKRINPVSERKYKAFRMALGLAIEDITDNTEFFGIQDFKARSTKFAIRIGGENQFNIAKRWAIISGYDFLLELDGTKIFTGQDLDEEALSRFDTKVGTGPVLGLQFFINKNISLSTESTMYLAYTFRKNKSDFFGGGNDEQEVQAFEFVLRIPTILFFNIRF